MKYWVASIAVSVNLYTPEDNFSRVKAFPCFTAFRRLAMCYYEVLGGKYLHVRPKCYSGGYFLPLWTARNTLKDSIRVCNIWWREVR